MNIGGGFLYWTSLLALVVKTLPVNAADIRDAGSKPGKMLWKRAWQPTPVFLPGESHGQRRLVGYSLWGPVKKSDMTEHMQGNKQY